MREAGDSSLGHWQGLQPGIPARLALLGAKRLESLWVYCYVTLGKSPWSSPTVHGNSTFQPVPCKILVRANEIVSSP